MINKGFNPQARWDRHIPVTAGGLDCRSLNENIEVMALFKAGRVYPRQFIWNGKVYKIKQINYNWQERRGRETISCFSVNTEPDLYQISFNNISLVWKIDKIID